MERTTIRECQQLNLSRTSRAYVVKPHVAKKQLATDVPPKPGSEIDDPPGPPYTPGEDGGTTPPLAPPDSPSKRFYGSINLDPIRAVRDRSTGS